MMTLEKTQGVGDLSEEKLQRRLVIDIDSTIWDPWPWFIADAKKNYDVELAYDAATDFGYFYRMLKQDQVYRMFDRVLDPTRTMRREFYPGCLEVLRYLSRGLAIELHFVSHNYYPEKMSEPIRLWLKRNLGFDQFHVAIGRTEQLDKVKYALERDCFGLIDDKPETLQDALWANLPLVATKRHPWNVELRGNSEGELRSFDGWFTFSGIVTKFLSEEKYEGLG